MSILICLASDTPFEKLENPHFKQMSVNEALARGIEVPRSMLMDPELDRDDPEAFLWTDIRIEISVAEGKAQIAPDPEDNFDVWPIDCADGLNTEKKYLAAVEWGQCTPARAGMLSDYIRRHMERAEETELWNIWEGEPELVRVHERRVNLSALAPEDILALCEEDSAHEKFVGGIAQWQQFCLVIKK